MNNYGLCQPHQTTMCPLNNKASKVSKKESVYLLFITKWLARGKIIIKLSENIYKTGDAASVTAYSQYSKARKNGELIKIQEPNHL